MIASSALFFKHILAACLSPRSPAYYLPMLPSSLYNWDKVCSMKSESSLHMIQDRCGGSGFQASTHVAALWFLAGMWSAEEKFVSVCRHQDDLHSQRWLAVSTTIPGPSSCLTAGQREMCEQSDSSWCMLQICKMRTRQGPQGLTLPHADDLHWYRPYSPTPALCLICAAVIMMINDVACPLLLKTIYIGLPIAINMPCLTKLMLAIFRHKDEDGRTVVDVW